MPKHPLHPTHPGSQPHIERLRAMCLALPEVTEKLAWGAPTWRVGGRLFAQLADHHHNNPHLAVWLAAPPGAQEALIEAEPGRFFRPAYVGHLGWVAAILDERSDWEMVAAVVRQAHREAASKLPARRRAAILAAEASDAAEASASPAARAGVKRRRPAVKKQQQPAVKKQAAAKKQQRPAAKKQQQRPAAKKQAASKKQQQPPAAKEKQQPPASKKKQQPPAAKQRASSAATPAARRRR
jgi:hypothetical protein